MIIDQLLQEEVLLLIAISYAILSTSSAVEVSKCNQTCGETTVPYPFGFSPNCKIPLNCSSTSRKAQLGSFVVRNITTESLLVDVPPSCNRSIDQLRQFNGSNYALSPNNFLLLRDCRKSSFSGCMISSDYIDHWFNPLSCPSTAKIICLPVANYSSGTNLTNTGCREFASAVYVVDEEANAPWLQFWKAEFMWWLDGECRCSDNASCASVNSAVANKTGFRCSCNAGFEGDGFADGKGCRKVISPGCNSSKYIFSNCGSSATKVGLLIGGIVAGACSTAAICFACYLIKRQRSNSGRIRQSTKLLLSQASLNVPFYTYREIEKATNSFSDDQRLGTGAYGTVYAGKLSNGKLVAIKRIKQRDTDSIDQVMNEIKLLSSVSHPNLVRLLGCCVDRGEQILVYEFMPNGTLSQHLQRERGNRRPLPWTARLSVAAETARAIAHLHSAVHPPIYHRDVKSTNILLDYKYTSKVADFGLSRLGRVSESETEMSHISTAPQGTPGYLDPQYHQNFHLSDKSDVYSFGVVLLEIITARKAVDFSRANEEIHLAAVAIEKIGKGKVEEIIDPWLEPNKDAWALSSIHKVAELAFRCLAFHRDMRPTMMEVAEELEQIRLSGAWASVQDDSGHMIFLSPNSSLRSSSTTQSSWIEKNRQTAMAPRHLAEGMRESSVSVEEDPWFSEQSSPSANSLLDNAVN